MNAPDIASGGRSEAGAGDAGRIDQLQSLRGLASMVVVLHHCSLVYRTPDGFRYAALAFNAHAAVIVFFVLSGYVLQMSLMRGSASLGTALTFLARRAFRILPVVVAITLAWFALAQILRLEPVPGASPWFSGMGPREGLSGWQVLLCMVGLSNLLIPPVWTITVELFGSLFMPLFDRIGRWRWQAAWVVAALLAGVVLVYSRTWPEPINSLVSLVPFDYLVYFCAGAALCRTPRLRWQAPLWLVAALAVGLIGVRVALIALRTGHVQFIEYMYGYWLASLAEGVFAIGLIYALTSSAASAKVLGSRVLTALGDVSYSVYLLHLPVITATVWLLGRLAVWNALDPVVRTLCLIAIVVGLTLPLASLSYRFIERPGIGLGKALLGGRRRLLAAQA